MNKLGLNIYIYIYVRTYYVYTLHTNLKYQKEGGVYDFVDQHTHRKK